MFAILSLPEPIMNPVVFYGREWACIIFMRYSDKFESATYKIK